MTVVRTGLPFWMPVRGSMRRMCASGAARALGARGSKSTGTRSSGKNGSRRAISTSPRRFSVRSSGSSNATDDLHHGRVRAEANAGSVAPVTPAVEADVFVVDELTIGRAGVLDRDRAGDRVD